MKKILVFILAIIFLASCNKKDETLYPKFEKVSEVNLESGGELSPAIIQSNLSAAKEYGLQLIKRGTIDQIVKGYSVLGLCFYFESNFQEAAKYFLNGIDLIKENDLPMSYDLYMWLGGVYFSVGDYENAIENYMLVYNDSPYGSDHYVKSALNIAVSYFDSQEYDKALDYYLELTKFSNNQVKLVDIYISVAACYKYSNHLKNEGYYSKMAYDLSTNIDYFEGKLRALINIGDTYYNLKKYDLAETFTLDALDLHNELEPSFDLVTIYINLGEINIYKNNATLAISYFQKGLALAQQLDYFEEEQRALSYLKKHSESVEEYRVYDEEYNKVTETMQALKESTSREQIVAQKEINAMLAERQVQAIKAKNEKLFITSTMVLGGVLLIFGLVFNLYRNVLIKGSLYYAYAILNLTRRLKRA